MTFGFYDSPLADAPAYDPGLNVDCPVCYTGLSVPIKTISVMSAGDNRSYFYRAHKHCYEALSPAQIGDLDGLIIDHVDTLRNLS